MADAALPRTRRELAQALGIVDDYVRALAQAGMPVSSIEAAKAWRRQNIRHAASRDRSDRAAARNLDGGDTLSHAD
jgi:hypothetical protein